MLSFKKKIGVTFFTIFVVILVALILLICTYPFLSQTEKKSSKDLFKYKYLRFNSDTKETDQGYIDLRNQLENKEFVSYSSGDVHHLISNIESSEYYCTGSCYCDQEESNSRRNTLVGSTTKKIISMLIATTTTAAVLQIAKTKFEDRCKSTFKEDECPSMSLRTTVTDCTKQYASSWLKKSEQEGLEDEDMITFQCIGKCKVNPKLETAKYYNPKVNEIGENYGCEKLKTSEQFIQDCYGLTSRECSGLARERFEKDHLVSFCKKTMESIHGFKKMWCVIAAGHCKESIQHSPKKVLKKY